MEGMHEYVKSFIPLKNRDRRGIRIKGRAGEKERKEDEDSLTDPGGHFSLDDEDDGDEDYSDVLSSDSDSSSLEEFRARLEVQQEKDDKKGKQEAETWTKKDEELERMFFYSIYIDQLPLKKRQPTVEPQTSEDYEEGQEYGNLIKEARDADSAKFVIDEFDEQMFNEVLSTDINEDEGMEDIDGNISIRTICDRNFKKLRMDGPSRRIAMLFTYAVEEKPISTTFLKFMHLQKERFPFISGVLLYFKGAGMGIHVIEGSEYILLMHLPFFFRDDCYKKMKICKILGVEQLSPMKFFEQYACYKAKPREPSEAVPKMLQTYEESIAFMKKIGKRLDSFFRFAYSDFPKVTCDNVLPENISNELPTIETLKFALEGKWVPGLRDVKDWFTHITLVPGEIDDSDYVWPIRSDGMPVHIMHPAPDEEETIREALQYSLKDKKLQLIPQFQPKAAEGEGLPPPPAPIIPSDVDEFEKVKDIVSRSSSYDDEKLDGDLEDLYEAEDMSED